MSVAPVTSLSFDRSSFPVVDCVHCGRRALTYLDDEVDERRCLSCDAVVGAELALLGRRSIERLGYVFMGRDAAAQNGRPAQSRCGSQGVRSCGSGGCSSGSCGTGGGCSGGCSVPSGS